MNIHIVPIGDLEEHTQSADCSCHPLIEIVDGNMLITHNSYDHRERLEEIIKIPYSLN